MTPQAILPAIVFPALYAWAAYRRIRRNIGRQPFQPTRKMVRIGILSLVGAGFLYGAAAAHASLAVEGGLVGLVLGAALGFVGLRLTRFESTPEGLFYTPNIYIGVGLSALFIGRLIYRFIVIGQVTAGPAAGTASVPPGTNPFAVIAANPLTLAIFTLLVGYYVTYYAGVLLRARNPTVT
jgi:hypothetical protein